VGDADYEVFAAYEAVRSNLSGAVKARVYPTYELSSTTQPLFHSNFHITNVLNPSNISGFSPKTLRKVKASGSIDIYLSTEAFLVNISCVDTTSTTNFTSNITTNPNLTTYSFDLPCASFRVPYLQSTTSTTYDTFACQDGTPLMFVWGVNTGSGTLHSMYQCSLDSALSVDADVKISRHTLATTIERVGTERRDLTSLPLTYYLGQVLLNRFGTVGWPELTRWMQDSQAGPDEQPLDAAQKLVFLSSLLSVEMTVALASFSGGLLNTVGGPDSDWLMFETVDRYVRPPLHPPCDQS
jgi:hypothetical protein